MFLKTPLVPAVVTSCGFQSALHLDVDTALIVAAGMSQPPPTTPSQSLRLPSSVQEMVCVCLCVCERVCVWNLNYKKSDSINKRRESALDTVKLSVSAGRHRTDEHGEETRPRTAEAHQASGAII